jgi:heterodisulfide reductase subunit D
VDTLPFFFHHDFRLTLFWVIHLIALGLFGLEMLYVLSIWLRGQVPGLPPDASRLRKLGAVIRIVLGVVFSRYLFVALKALVRDGLLHLPLFERSKSRWLAHIATFGSFFLLGILSTITGLAVEFLYPIFHIEHPLVLMLINFDHPMTAFTNEFLGLLLLAGLIFIVYRRFVLKDAQLRTIAADKVVLGFLFAIVLTGYPLEAFRLLADEVTNGPLQATAALGFIGYPLSRLIKPLNWPWEALHFGTFFFHFAIVTLLMFYMPFSKFFHVLMSPLVVVISSVHRENSKSVYSETHRFVDWSTNLRTHESTNLRTHQSTSLPKIDPSHFSIRQLLELEGCTRCGECITWCPTFSEKELDEITPLDKIHTLKGFIKGQYGGLLARLFGYRPPTGQDIARWSRGTYDCTLCGRCNVVCPVHINTRPLWIAMREQLVELGEYPELMNALRDTVTTKYNISGDPNQNRLGWSANLERVPEGMDHRVGAEVVYFMGCVAAFYPMVYSVPQTMVQIMEKAGVDFTTLGGDEWCCGFPLIIAGMGKWATELIRHNVEAVRALGAKTLMAACPSCFHTWKHDYPRIIGEPLGFEVVHATELLAGLIKDGRLELKGFPDRVTYHDPCDLGRTSGVYDAPRQIINSVPGISFTEMEDHRERSLCCGGGGDVEMADRELTAAVAQRRLEQAQATGAQWIVTACQQCQRTLLTAARREKIRLRTIDVSEFVWRAMEME